MALTLVIMAAGLATRFGGPKQLEPVGPAGEILLDYGVYDAARAGFARVAVVVRREVADAVRAHLRAWIGDRVNVDLVEQRVDDLPASFPAPANRVKPWGTGQAVLAARAVVDGPFAVCNADDFYGAGAYRVLAAHLAGGGDSHAVVGYRLDETLSPYGGVARAVCECDSAGFVRRIVEVSAARGADGAIVGSDAGGEPRSFTGAEPVSMNLWGFRPYALAALRDQFREFLERQGGDPESEFLLPAAVSEQVAEGRARLQVLPAPDRWFGLTFAADVPAARAALAELVRAGAYPDDLRAGFARL